MNDRQDYSDKLGAQGPGAQQGPGGRTHFKKRKTLSPFSRMVIIAAWGSLLACITFYGLMKIGF